MGFPKFGPRTFAGAVLATALASSSASADQPQQMASLEQAPPAATLATSTTADPDATLQPTNFNNAAKFTIRYGRGLNMTELADVVGDIRKAGCDVTLQDDFRPRSLQALRDPGGEVVTTGRDVTMVGGAVIDECTGNKLDLF